MKLEEYLLNHYSTSVTKHMLWLIKRFRVKVYRSEEGDFDTVLDYINKVRKEGSKAKTLKHHLFAIKAYYRWLQEVGVRLDHPCEQMQLKDKIDRRIHLDTLYSIKELELFLKDYSRRDLELENRDKMMLSLLIHQGLHVSELVNLKIEDIDLVEGTIEIKESRNLNGRTLNLKANQVFGLLAYLEGKAREGFLFSNRYGKAIRSGAISVILSRNGKYHYKPMKIRQSVIKGKLKQGNDLRLVQYFSGHKRSSSTQEYESTKAEELKMNVLKFHPIS